MPPTLIVRVLGDTSHLERSFKRADRSAKSFSLGLIASQRSLTGFGRAATLTGAGLGFALGGAFVSTISKAAQFQKTLNVLQAVTGATATRMKEAGLEAKRLGADMTLPKTSAADAAVAMTELAKGGLTLKNSLDAARGTLQLSAAANISAGEAAQIAARQLNAFQLQGKEAGRVADVLANLANVATGEITDFAFAFQQSSAVANKFNLSIEQTGAALAIMANRGIVGSDAGTSFRVMLTRLVPQTKKATDAMAALGIQWKDANGNIVPFRNQLEQYHDALKRLAPAERQQAIQTIFGADAQRAANIVFGSSVQTFDKMLKAVSRQGAAAKLSAAQNKGFSGAMDALKSSLETLQITLGTKLLPVLTEIVKFVNRTVVAFDKFAEAAGGTKLAVEVLIATFAAFKFRSIIFGLTATAGATKKIELNSWAAGAAVGNLKTKLLGISGAIAGLLLAEQALDRIANGPAAGPAPGAPFPGNDPKSKNALFAPTTVQITTGGRSWKQALQTAIDQGKLTPETLAEFRVNVTPQEFKDLQERLARRLKPIAGDAIEAAKRDPNRGVTFAGISGAGSAGRLPLKPAAVRGLEAFLTRSTQLALASARTEVQQRAALGKELEDVNKALRKRLAFADKLALEQEKTQILSALQSMNEAEAAERKRGVDAADDARKKAAAAAKKAIEDRAKKAAAAIRTGTLGVTGGLKIGDVNAAIAGREQAAQFRALGLTATGQAFAPTGEALRGQADRISKALTGTIFDTNSNRNKIAQVRKVLAGQFGALTRETREHVKSLLDAIQDPLKDAGKDSGFRHVSPNKLARALGLGTDRDSVRRAAAILSQIGPGGTAPGRSSQAFAGAGAGGGGITVNGNLIVQPYNYREFERDMAKRARAKAQPRRGVK
jgi:TP901 family phage tail tape measure protein